MATPSPNPPPPDPARYHGVLRARRLLRWAFFAGAALLAVGVLSLYYLSTQGITAPGWAAITVKGLFFLVIVSSILLRILPCPHCGRAYGEGRPYLYIFHHRCPHCGLG